jgi:hypothetical protein
MTIGTIGPDEFARWQAQSRILEGLRLVFIVGPSKCGTSWVQTTLNGHPNAVAWAEGAFVPWLRPPLQDAVGKFNAAHERAQYPFDLRLTPEDLAMLTRQAFDRVLLRYLAGAKPGHPLLAIIDKTPTHGFHVAELAATYPWAKFVLVTRDVRDAAVSWWHFMNLQGRPRYATIEECALAYAKIWADLIGKARADGACLGPDRFAEIRYEDYKAEPHAQIARLLRYIGLPADEAHVNVCVEFGDFTRLAKGRSPGSEARSFFRKGVVGDWSNHLSPELGERVLAEAGSIVAGAMAA